MKVDEEIKKELVKNLKEWQKELNYHIDFCIEGIKNSKTVEDIMRYKRNLLYMCVRELPLQATTCYFCLLHRDKKTEDLNCEDCEYGKLHGICFEPDSDYQSILKIRNQLRCEIEFLYFNNDKYDE